MRSLACTLAVIVSTSALAAPSYPVVVPLRSKAFVAAREAEFRKRNPQRWSTVEVNARGFVSHVHTDDPALVPEIHKEPNGWWRWTDPSLDRVRALLRRNADLFGIDRAMIDRIDARSLVVTDVVDTALVGEIVLQRFALADHPAELDITTMFSVHLEPKFSIAEATKRVIGRSYEETDGFGAPPMIDCAMTPAGAAGCKTPVVQRQKRDVTLAAGDLRTVTWLHADSDRIRLVRCIDAGNLAPMQPGKPGLGLNERSFAPLDHAPALPLVVDAVTGAEIDLHVTDCFTSGLSNVR
jgi:hypothetical protein